MHPRIKGIRKDKPDPDSRDITFSKMGLWIVQCALTDHPIIDPLCVIYEHTVPLDMDNWRPEFLMN